MKREAIVVLALVGFGLANQPATLPAQTLQKDSVSEDGLKTKTTRTSSQAGEGWIEEWANFEDWLASQEWLGSEERSASQQWPDVYGGERGALLEEWAALLNAFAESIGLSPAATLEYLYASSYWTQYFGDRDEQMRHWGRMQAANDRAHMAFIEYIRGEPDEYRNEYDAYTTPWYQRAGYYDDYGCPGYSNYHCGGFHSTWGHAGYYDDSMSSWYRIQRSNDRAHRAFIDYIRN